MKETNTIRIIHVGNEVDIDRIDGELKALILTSTGTIPGSRNFGLTGEYLSRPPNEAVNVLAMELEEKVEEFIPEIEIVNVEGAITEPFGEMKLKIYVEGAEEI